MVTKEEAKREIQKLIEKYERLSSQGKLKGLNEETTKSWFIEPLFNALGWEINEEDVTKEEKVSKGRADYAFKTNGVTKFFLEAKAIKEDLDNPKFAKQTVEYGWNRSITWAVLTDFEGLKVFNCEWKEKDLWRNILFDLNYKQFLEEFDKLWLLSKESFILDNLGTYAEKIGKRIPRRKISDYLLGEFIDWRTRLLSTLKKDQPNYSEEDRDEIVQNFLDRIIFIRHCEDRGYEEKKLESALREFELTGKNLNKALKDIFRYYDNNYDSKIFLFREVDKIEFQENILKDIIKRVYKTKDENIAYDFSLIDADILGNLYEQYLSHISRRSDEKNKVKKKSQGIYYTPISVVDYIIKNTLGEMLKNKKIDISKIKLLDPACGSGSFLIKSFDVLNSSYRSRDKNYNQKTFADDGTTYSIKERILKSNIFGVDLDKQAVEIAQLNLLLKIAEKGHRLPLLQKNIQNGNSLIDDSSIAGDKAFNWEEHFPGGLDIIVGNPPYVFAREKINSLEKNYYSSHYETAKYQVNTYLLFIEKAIKLLKDDGLLGFIVPDAWLRVESASALRKYLLENCFLEKIVHLRGETFQGVGVESSIVILRKTKKIGTTKVYTDLFDSKCTNFSQKEWLKNSNFEIDLFSDKSAKRILEKISAGSTSLDKISNIKAGLQAYEKDKGKPKQTSSDVKSRPYDYNHKFDKDTFRYLEGKDIGRYSSTWNGNAWLRYGEWLAAPRSFDLFSSPRILIREITSKPPYSIVSTYSEETYLNNRSIINILEKGEGFRLKYLLAILNSKIITFYHLNKSVKAQRDLFPKVTLNDVRQFPVKIISLSEQDKIISLVDRLLILNKKLSEMKDKITDQRTKIEEDIDKTNNQIDEMIYIFYEITKSEKKIIEESLK